MRAAVYSSVLYADKDGVARVESARFPVKVPSPFIKDITGQRFGKLVALKAARTYRHVVFWLCSCDCGTVVERNGTELRRGLRVGRMMSCGCHQRPDLSGRRIGKLTVVGFSHVNRDLRYHEGQWHVVCDCGTRTIIGGHDLAKGDVKSCGCLRHERTSECLANGAKECSRCHVRKTTMEFGKYSYSRDSRQSLCRECMANRRLMKHYGITLSDKRAMLEAQGHICANRRCMTRVTVQSAVDHCHKSGQVRSILCTACNTSLGLLRESSSRIVGLAEYCRRTRQLNLFTGSK